MLHPSYTELIAKVNEGVEPGDEPVVQSRYSIVCATAKRARQIVDEANRLNEPDTTMEVKKPLSDAVMELDRGRIYIMTEDEYNEEKSIMLSEVEEKAIIKAQARKNQIESEKLNAAMDEADEKIDFDEDDDEVIDVDDTVE